MGSVVYAAFSDGGTPYSSIAFIVVVDGIKTGGGVGFGVGIGVGIAVGAGVGDSVGAEVGPGVVGSGVG
jgi:hypothetical protein